MWSAHQLNPEAIISKKKKKLYETFICESAFTRAIYA